MRLSVPGAPSFERAMYREPYRKFFKKPPRIVVEIGTWRGGWASRCLSYWPEIERLYCVDPWVGTAEPHLATFRKRFAKQLASGQVVEVREFSSTASAEFTEKIDLLNIDGDHYDVYSDLCYWLPHVKSRGVVLGHDFSGHRQSPAVQGALFAYFGHNIVWKSGNYVGRNSAAAQRIHSFAFRKQGAHGEQDARFVEND
jgi:hypothetical protein